MERFELILLGIAKKDLETSELLFSKGLYPQAVFYLQQAIEKTVKSLGIWNKIINKNEAKKDIGHNVWRLYRKIFVEALKMIPLFKGYLNRFPELRDIRLIKELELNLPELKSKDYEMQINEDIERASNLSYRELQNIIDGLKKIRDPTIFSNFKEMYNEVLDEILARNPNAIDVKAVKEKLEVIKPEDLHKFIFCWLSLYWPSLILSHHAVKSRYPENNFNPLKEYTSMMPLIQTFESFIEIIKEVLEWSEDLLKDYPSGLRLT